VQSLYTFAIFISVINIGITEEKELLKELNSISVFSVIQFVHV
jgi:hypothetical protein